MGVVVQALTAASLSLLVLSKSLVLHNSESEVKECRSESAMNVETEWSGGQQRDDRVRAGTRRVVQCLDHVEVVDEMLTCPGRARPGVVESVARHDESSPAAAVGTSVEEILPSRRWLVERIDRVMGRRRSVTTGAVRVNASENRRREVHRFCDLCFVHSRALSDDQPACLLR